MILSACNTGTIRLWDIHTGKCIADIKAHVTQCSATEIHPYGNLFGTAATDGTVKIWDARTQKCVQGLRWEDSACHNMKFSPHGRWLASTGRNSAKIWDLGEAAFIFEKEDTTAVAFHPVDFYFLTAGAKLRMWNCAKNFDKIAEVGNLHGTPQLAEFCEDGNKLIVSDGENVSVAHVSEEGKMSNVSKVADVKVDAILDLFPTKTAGLLLSREQGNPHTLTISKLVERPVKATTRDVPVEIVTSSRCNENSSNHNSTTHSPSLTGSKELKKLQKHVASVRRVIALWTKGATLQAAGEAAEDAGLFANFLNALPLERTNIPLSLDLCRQLVVLIPRAVSESKNNDALPKASAHAAAVLLSRFGDFIRDTREVSSSAGVDLQRDLRVEKCNDCFEGFRRIYSALSRCREVGDLETLRAFIDN